ncbi:hypothetical protein ARMGADRAFT_1036571 [Armillaria gallica]|uniref:Uncharacterized protein n=1 Tax=Armillaria gallica TaxID=47427 RepID=A0A2H3DC35_ARMGA|nr:hypothetical protein ARMGADRAFT_1036571 [Armillaria gallica]
MPSEEVNVTGEGVVDVVDDDGRRKVSCANRSLGSPSPSDCEHAPTHKASKRSSSGRARKQQLFLPASSGFLTRRFLSFAPPTVAAPQPERRSDLLPCSTPPKFFKTNIPPSNITAFAILPATSTRTIVPRYETQLPKQTALDILVDTACYSGLA